tara:strand:- start:506 stop:679 length:174 start_codon:yes stop_codon:yes gene_type:complete
MYGMRRHQLIANPILGLVIDVIENFVILFIDEQPFVEDWSYASIQLDSEVLKVTKLT